MAHGLGDVAFLEGISLPDGRDPGPLSWNGRKLLPLPGVASMQYDAEPDVRSFFDHLLVRWLGLEQVERVVADFGPAVAGSSARRELAARMKLWKRRDHGRVAELAHAVRPLTIAQLREVDRLTRDPRGDVQVAKPTDAVMPLLPISASATPIVPYIIRLLPDADGRSRRVAIMRLRYAPYDTIALVIERGTSRWELTHLLSAVDE